MVRLVLLASVLAPCLLAPAATSQPLTLTPRPDAESGLPPSIRVFDVTREGTPLRASLLRANPFTSDWVMEAVLSDEGSETVPSFARDEGVYAALNGGFFGGGQSYSLVLNGGAVLSPNVKALTRDGTTYFPTRGAFTMSYGRSPDVGWVYDVDGVPYAYPAPSPNAPGAPQPRPTASFPEGGAPLTSVRAAIGGGPVLVQDGAVDVTYDQEVFFGGSGVDLTTRRARTAIGYTSAPDAHVLFVAVPEASGVTLGELAELMAELGATEALNLDGGGSSAMSSGGVDLVPSTRPVLSAVRLRDPSAIDGTQGRVYDTGDDGYSETGGWFESANAPFAAGTPSRLNAVGGGADRAVFRFADLAAGRYAVEAWWTPASNRATDTPFTIYRGGTATTVRADQSAAGSAGVWNRLGEFDLAAGDSVVVTDDASGAGTDVYVVVDALRILGPLGTTQTGEPARSTGAVRVGPNPATSHLSVTLEHPRPGPVTVELVDALGRVVRRVDRPGADATVTLDLRGLRSAVYVLRVASSTGTQVRAVTVAR